MSESVRIVYAVDLTEEDSRFVVRFPDCEGCLTQGDTREEALAMAEEALNSWLAAHLDLGRIPPRPKARGEIEVTVGEELGAAIKERWDQFQGAKAI